MKSNKTSAGNTAVTPKMGAVIIVTAIHALIFCSVLQMQEVSANCVPSMMSHPPATRPVETVMTQSNVLPTLMEPTVDHRGHRDPSEGCQDGTRRTSRRDEEILGKRRAWDSGLCRVWCGPS